MSEQVTVDQVVALASRLPPAERRQLAEMILAGLGSHPEASESPPRRSWREIRGSVPYPMCGEDAQAWISRTRREADETRERQRRGGP